MASSVFSRRALLGGFAVASAGLAFGALGDPAYAAPETPVENGLWLAPNSQNGWPVSSQPPAIQVEGSSIVLSVTDGDVRDVLNYVVRRFSYEIQTLLPEEVFSWQPQESLVNVEFESNYVSGTAVAIRPGAFPLGANDCFFPNEELVVRDILADCEGVVRWGRDFEVRKESHFQIDVGPGDERLQAVAEKIRAWNEAPGQGAGAVDPFTPARVEAAEELAEEQEVP